MTKILLVGVLSAFFCCGQSSNDSLQRRTQELQTLINAGDWDRAAGLSTSLRKDILGARDQSLSANTTTFVDALLTWLPQNTETLVVAQQPFTLITDERREYPSALRSAQSYILGLLGSAEKGALVKTLRERTIASAALTARNFHSQPPIQKNGMNIVPLGMIAYEGCAIYNFIDPLPANLLSRSPEDSLLGFRLWTSKGSQNDTRDTDTFLVSILEPRMLAVCNDRAFLQELITRRGQPQEPRALPPLLQEWQLVDRTAALWAVSHYAPNNAARRIADAPQAIGIGFSYSASSAITARMLSSSDPWKVADSPDFNGAARSKRVAEGIWELSVSPDARAGFFATFVLMAYAGFAVVI